MMNMQDSSVKPLVATTLYPLKKDPLSTEVRNNIEKILMGLTCCA